MNVVIVTNSTSYEPRAERVAEFFRSRGHQVQLVESDFFHREKSKEIRLSKPRYYYVDTIPYKKNLSMARLYSHYDFAKKAFQALTSGLVTKEAIDLLYVMIPANSLTRMAARYKRSHPETKLVLDIIDLWPESLPIPVIKNIFPCTVWRNLRDKHLQAADMIFTECGLYREVLGEQLKGLNVETLYWPKERIEDTVEVSDGNTSDTEVKSTDEIGICYLGSINNIIDINYIAKLLTEINRHRKVVLHIIGDGESRDEFLERMHQEKFDVRYHGAIYDESHKRRIMQKCTYGLNIMKNTVCVGLTMKSVEYLANGLMLLNNIPGDTWKLVEIQKIGCNCGGDNQPQVATQAVSQIVIKQQQYVRSIYQMYFSLEAFEKQLEKNLLG